MSSLGHVYPYTGRAKQPCPFCGSRDTETEAKSEERDERGRLMCIRRTYRCNKCRSRFPTGEYLLDL